MSKMEYMPVDCLQVPKVLFQMEKYKKGLGKTNLGGHRCIK